MTGLSPVLLKRIQAEALVPYGITPLKMRAHRGQVAVYITSEQMTKLVRTWCDATFSDDGKGGRGNSTGIMPPALLIADEGDGYWSVCEGLSGDCYCETYASERIALRWLFWEDEDLIELEKASMAIEKRRAIK